MSKRKTDWEELNKNQGFPSAFGLWGETFWAKNSDIFDFEPETTTQGGKVMFFWLFRPNAFISTLLEVMKLTFWKNYMEYFGKFDGGRMGGDNF